MFKMKLPKQFPLPNVLNVRQVFLLILVLFISSYSFQVQYSGTINNPLPPLFSCNFRGGYGFADLYNSVDQNSAQAPAGFNYRSLNYYVFASSSCSYDVCISNRDCSSGGNTASSSMSGSTASASYQNSFSYKCCPTGTNCADLKGTTNVTVICDFVGREETLPQCSDFLPVPASACKGGNGLSLTGNPFYIQGVLQQAFPNATDEVPGIIWVPSNPNISSDTLTRPDGSKCNYFNQGSGEIYNYTVCPLGFEKSCEEDPSQPQCQNSSSSTANESSSSSGTSPDLCAEFPELPGCNNQGGNSSGSGGDEGGTCEDMSNCDWAKVDIQLQELGVAVEIRNKISDLSALVQNGYNLTQEQNNLLNGVIGAINSGNLDVLGAIGDGTENITGSIDGLGEGIASGFSDLGEDISYGFNDLERAIENMGLSDSTGDGINCSGSYCDTTGLLGGIDGTIGKGAGLRPYTNAEIQNAIPVANSNVCPIYTIQPIKFPFGAGNIYDGGQIDFNDPSGAGIDVMAIFRALLMTIVYITNVGAMIAVVRSGGRA